MKFNQSCSSKPPDPYSHSHGSPAHAPTAPRTPLHGCILVHFSGLEILVRKVICGAHLLVILVLLRPTEIGLVMSRVGENVVGSPLSVDHGHFARRKLLELLLLRGRLGGNHLKAGSHQHALFVLRAGRCGAAGRQRQQRYDADHVECDSHLFHNSWFLPGWFVFDLPATATGMHARHRFALRSVRTNAIEHSFLPARPPPNSWTLVLLHPGTPRTAATAA